MKSYELSVLFHPDLEMNLDPALDKVTKIVKSNGGKIDHSESDGKKRLAYAIAGQDFAVYYYYTVSLPPDAPAKVSSAMNIADEVLRYLLVRTDERRLKAEARAKARAAHVAESEAKGDKGAKESKEANESKDAEDTKETEQPEKVAQMATAAVSESAAAESEN